MTFGRGEWPAVEGNGRAVVSPWRRDTSARCRSRTWRYCSRPTPPYAALQPARPRLADVHELPTSIHAARMPIVAMPTLVLSILALSVRPDRHVVVRDTGGVKGLGVFAAKRLAAGSWVGCYRGELRRRTEALAWYAALPESDPRFAKEYVFEIDVEWCIDAQNASHFSRYLNHAEDGTLQFEIDAEAKRVDFYAARDVGPDEELTFDYGPLYWRNRSPPSPETDSRDYGDPYYSTRPPELSLLHPPPVGTVLPLTPQSAAELQAALMLPTEAAHAALLRCAEYFGARRAADGALELWRGQDRWHSPSGTKAPSFATLQDAAAGYIADATIEDAAGRAQFLRGLAEGDRELELVRSWRTRVPRLASARRDAVALAAYLLWKNPGGHAVFTPLTREACNALIAQSASEAADGAERVVEALAQHAPAPAVGRLLEVLERCIVLGDGCTVASHAPPRLEGAVPGHLRRVWDRVPELVESGHLSSCT